jgi:hypothetical protein
MSVALPLAAALAACGGGTDAVVNAGGGQANEAVAAPAPAPVANQAAAVAPGDPTAGWNLPMRPSRLTAAERDAIFRAAGYHKRGGQWDASDEPGSAPEDSCPATIQDQLFDRGPAIRDLNGDGRPEVIVTSMGLACYGMTGQAFEIVTPTATGWRHVFGETGIPTFIRRAGSAWPDIVIGGPGTCFPKVRWNGRDYVDAGGDDGEGHACTIPGMEDTPPPAPPPSAESARPVGPLGLAAGYFVEEASPCTDPAGMVYYYDGRRYAVIYPNSPDSGTVPIGHPQRSGGQWEMDDGSQVEVLSPTRMRFTYEETGPPMRLCPTSRIPARLRVR